MTEPEEIVIRDGAAWTAAKTRPRCEKVVAEYCVSRALPCYLPLRRRTERYQRRTVVSFLPMFPGYLFVQLGADRKTELLQSHKILQILQTTPDSEAILVRELHELRKLECAACAAEIEVKPEIAKGKMVLINKGPLNGLTGIVMRRADRVRVTVNVELLGQSASVELDIGEVVLE